MELEVIPSQCKTSKDESGAEIPAPFSGSVTVRLPSMGEAYKFKAKYGRKMHDVDLKKLDNTESIFALMDLTGDLCEEIRGNFIKVNIKEVSTGKELKSADEIFTYEPAFEIVAEIGLKFVKGFAEKN